MFFGKKEETKKEKRSKILQEIEDTDKDLCSLRRWIEEKYNSEKYTSFKPWEMRFGRPWFIGCPEKAGHYTIIVYMKMTTNLLPKNLPEDMVDWEEIERKSKEYYEATIKIFELNKEAAQKSEERLMEKREKLTRELYELSGHYECSHPCLHTHCCHCCHCKCGDGNSCK